jgi:hypothetical protein
VKPRAIGRLYRVLPGGMVARTEYSPCIMYGESLSVEDVRSGRVLESVAPGEHVADEPGLCDVPGVAGTGEGFVSSGELELDDHRHHVQRALAQERVEQLDHDRARGFPRDRVRIARVVEVAACRSELP